MIKIKKSDSVLKKPKLKELNNFSTLSKLRLVVLLIFSLLTLSFILVFVNNFIFAATLIIISYLILIGLLVKLFRIKKI